MAAACVAQERDTARDEQLIDSAGLLIDKYQNMRCSFPSYDSVIVDALRAGASVEELRNDSFFGELCMNNGDIRERIEQARDKYSSN